VCDCSALRPRLGVGAANVKASQEPNVIGSQGVGSALLRHGEKEIAARDIATAHLSVIASNKRAIAFYEKRGWRPLRKTPHEIAPAPRQEMIKMVG